MPREAKLGPDWLTSLLVCWGRQRLDEASKGKGFYTINPMLKDGIPTPARSYEPTGFSWQDYSDLEKAVGGLETLQQLAVARYCMPWRIAMIDAEHDYMTTRRWLVLLRESLALLDLALSRKAA
jgi:hypothetical protein